MDYTSRTGWGSSQSDPAGSPIGPVSLVVVHHFHTPNIRGNTTPAREAQVMRSVQDHHVITNGWDDIGYQWVAFETGRVYEGRGWGRSGAHVAEDGVNGRSVAIAFPINGDLADASPAAWDAAGGIVRAGLAGGHIVDGYDVEGHHGFASYKTCPGTKVHPHIGRLAGLSPDTTGLTMADADDILDAIADLKDDLEDEKRGIGWLVRSARIPDATTDNPDDTLPLGWTVAQTRALVGVLLARTQKILRSQGLSDADIAAIDATFAETLAEGIDVNITVSQ